jgi:hypothetical protein
MNGSFCLAVWSIKYSPQSVLLFSSLSFRKQISGKKREKHKFLHRKMITDMSSDTALSKEKKKQTSFLL